MNELTVYAEVGSFFQQVGGDCPAGWVRMNAPRPEDEGIILHTAQSDGTWVISEETLKNIAAADEVQWREVEMPIALENVTAIDFGDDTVPGTAAQWKAYWLALRNWKDGNPDYPDLTKRPPRPS